MKLKYDFAQNDRSAPPVKESLQGLEGVCGHLDAVVLSSRDPFISEYVPIANNHRYGATRFTGSTGDAIYFTETFRKKHPNVRPVALFVDGRYHLQADRETDSALVDVVKLDVEPNIEGSILSRVLSYGPLKLGMDFERTSISTLSRFQSESKGKGIDIVHVDGNELLKALKIPGWGVDRPIRSVPEAITGRTIAKTLKALQQDMTHSGYSNPLHVTVATDDAAFLLNARGFHLPNHSSVLAYTFFAGQELVVFLPECSKDSKVDLEEAQLGEYRVHVIRNSIPELKRSLKQHSVKTVLMNGATINALLPAVIQEVFPGVEIKTDYTWLLKTRARKTPEEMASIRASFLKSSRAIARTLRFAKSESRKRNFSEMDLAQKLAEEFQNEGAVAHSFKTISGAAGNSAIVHYSTPSSTTYFEKGAMGLLDCGAYYEEGFATDTTRGFFVGGAGSGIDPEPWQCEIYTSTLKAAISVFLQPMDANLSGKEVDALVRGKVKAAGYDYLHGTGHGVGIHVHEEGIRFSSLSKYHQSPYACVSVEPGIYLKDKGGVRVENVVLLVPEGNTHYRYENVVFVGYEWDLIDLSKLTEEEKAYLKVYEQKCEELGTHLTSCPL